MLFRCNSLSYECSDVPWNFYLKINIRSLHNNKMHIVLHYACFSKGSTRSFILRYSLHVLICGWAKEKMENSIGELDLSSPLKGVAGDKMSCRKTTKLNLNPLEAIKYSFIANQLLHLMMLRSKLMIFGMTLLVCLFCWSYLIVDVVVFVVVSGKKKHKYKFWSAKERINKK